MDLKTYETLVKSESASRRYLLGFCWKNHQRFCPRCASRGLYRLKDDRRRCKRCGYTFHDFSRRWLNECGLSPSQWLRLVKLFELEVGPTQASEQLGAAYNTVYKGMCIIRRAILAHAHDAGDYYGNSARLLPDFCGGTAATGTPPPGSIPVFGLTGHNGDTRVCLIHDLYAETVPALDLPVSSLGQVVYTDRYQQWETMVFCGKSRVPAGDCAGGCVHVDGSRGFWSYCKARLHRMSGVSAFKFPLYLKELEFRYAHRGEDVFPRVASYLCDFLPDLEESEKRLS